MATFTLVVGAATFAQARSVVDLARDADDWRAAGASVQVVTLAGGIDGAQCDALAATDGVAGAGALRSSDPVHLAALPSTSVQAFEATPGLADGCTPPPWPTPGWASGSRTTWPTTSASTRPAPGSPAPTASPSRSPPPSPTRPTDGRSPWLGARFDAVSRIDALPTWQLTAAAIAAAISLAVTLIRLRRLELASALHAGLDRTSLLIQTGVETLVWLLAATALVAPVAWWAAVDGNPDPPGTPSTRPPAPQP